MHTHYTLHTEFPKRVHKKCHLCMNWGKGDHHLVEADLLRYFLVVIGSDHSVLRFISVFLLIIFHYIFSWIFQQMLSTLKYSWPIFVIWSKIIWIYRIFLHYSSFRSVCLLTHTPTIRQINFQLKYIYKIFGTFLPRFCYLLRSISNDEYQ